MEIKKVESRQMLEECFNIRHDVFTKEQNVPEEIDMDEFDVLDDSISVHALLYEGSSPVATGRLKYIANDTVQLNRIAVRKEYRGRGYGEKVVAFLEEEARRRGYRKVFLESQLYAKGFYEKCGYSVISKEPFLEAGILHVGMIKSLY